MKNKETRGKGIEAKKARLLYLCCFVTVNHSE